MFDDEDEEECFQCDKFEDCGLCKNRFDEPTCDDCDVGENFEEEDYDEVDKYFQGRT
jgi:hypothetical protein